MTWTRLRSGCWSWVRAAWAFFGDENVGEVVDLAVVGDDANELRLPLCKLGMLPLPRSLPFAHAERVLDADGGLAEQSDWAAKVAAFVPWSLNELVCYSAALKPLRAA
ncbi:hypothetical protein ACFRU3_37210 [Streptomyces sp. NPDC056910]|uniref:hypothetical protein n=1 Tax=Streptomyces sp. NPDC056910 TaxID=3345964 RepID=UPI00367A516C